MPKVIVKLLSGFVDREGGGVGAGGGLILRDYVIKVMLRSV